MVDPKLTLKKANDVLDDLNGRYADDGNLKPEIIKDMFDGLRRRVKPQVEIDASKITPAQTPPNANITVKDTVPTAKNPTAQDSIPQYTPTAGKAPESMITPGTTIPLTEKPPMVAPSSLMEDVKEPQSIQELLTMATKRSPDFKNILSFTEGNILKNQMNKRVADAILKDEITPIDIPEAQYILSKLNRFDKPTDFIKALASLGMEPMPGKDTGETLSKSSFFNHMKNSLMLHTSVDSNVKKAIAEIVGEQKLEGILPQELNAGINSAILNYPEGKSMKGLGLEIGKALYKYIGDPYKSDKKLSPEEADMREVAYAASKLISKNTGLFTIISKSNFNGGPGKVLEAKIKLGVPMDEKEIEAIKSNDRLYELWMNAQSVNKAIVDEEEDLRTYLTVVRK
jgi:hypothetical protein